MIRIKLVYLERAQPLVEEAAYMDGTERQRATESLAIAKMAEEYGAIAKLDSEFLVKALMVEAWWLLVLLPRNSYTPQAVKGLPA
jgi:hypothetical protein